MSTAFTGATRRTYTLEELGQDWAAAGYDDDYSFTCLEARQLPIFNSYPYPGGGYTLAQHLAKIDGRTDKGLTLSHLCHNRLCIRRSHLVREPMPVNHGRSACPGGLWCAHRTRCLRPGRFSHSFLADDDELA